MESKNGEKFLVLDLHTHFSEKNVKPMKFWQRVMQEELDGVAITEHVELNPRKAFEELNKAKPPEKILIPGMELNTEIGHVLCFGRNASVFDARELMQKGLSIKKALRIARERNLVLALAHPWGYSKDSAGFYCSHGKLLNLVKKEGLGVETYNGMLGYLSYYVFDSGLIKVPMKTFDFIEKNRLLKRTPLRRLSSRLKNRMQKEIEFLIRRCAAAIELGKEAGIVVAGSDAHYPERIGSGILKLRYDYSELSPENVLNALRNKENVGWTGPKMVKEKEGVYHKVDKTISKKELINGLRYASFKALAKKIGLKRIKRVLAKQKKKVVAKVRQMREGRRKND